jgi:hypothetical protein
MTLKDQAEFFARALESGLKTVSEVIAWADENIMQLETPPIWLLELSLMGKVKTQDVVNMLRQADGVVDEAKVSQAYLQMLLEQIRIGIWSAEECCRFLDRIHEHFTESRSFEIRLFSERYYWLTDDEIISSETSEVVDVDFIAFLERASGAIP